MESHHHHHQLQDQIVGSSAPSCYGLGITTSPSSFFNNASSLINSSTMNSNYMTSLLSSQYNYPGSSFNYEDLQPAACRLIKDQLSDQYYRNYTELLSSSSSVTERNEGSTKLKSGNLIFPSVNVSNLNEALAGMNHLDALANSSRLINGNGNGDFLTPSPHNPIGFSFGFDHMQPHIPFHNNKVSNAAVQQPKRNSNKIEPKALLQNAPKKSRSEARSSCPPFKVRKEKLGDRIAALQQLVAPFGKTDTASVLMEAIGYIKFLQSQVETLSVPYMKASRNMPNRVMKGGPTENENEELRRDLKSRGLCLVPLTCLSYITDGGGTAVWPPPQFGGAT